MTKRDVSGSYAFEACDYTKEKDYWLQKLSGELNKTTYPTDGAGPQWEGDRMETLEFSLDGEIAERIMKISRGSDYVVHMILLAGVAAQLYRYTGSGDQVVGVPIYKQEKEAAFLNTVLPLRTGIQETTTFKEQLVQVKKAMVEAVDHQNYPMETLLFNLGYANTGDGEFPLFDVAVLLNDIHDPEYIRHTRPNVIFTFERAGGGIRGKVEYNAKNYREDTLRGIVRHYRALMKEALYNIDEPVSGLEILTEEEKKQVLETFNDTAGEYPRQKTIDEIFRQQADEVPGNVAVTYEGEPMTYRRLKERATALAATLRKKGVTRQQPVAIMAENSHDVIVALQAILEAGGAYVPVNADYPEERKKYILRDSGAKLLLTNRPGRIDYDDNADDYDNGVEEVDLEDEALYQIEQIEKIEQKEEGGAVDERSSGDLAYIMYTSGSTGTPKGVMVDHRSVVRLVKNTNYIDFEKGDGILLTGALEFDASTFEIWGALLNGQTLHMLQKDNILNPAMIKQGIRENGVTIMWMTSPLFNQMLDADIEIFDGIRKLLVGGDVLSPVHINRVRKRYPELKVINGYGPTENTTFSITHRVEKEYSERIPIGKPIANSTAYILDGRKKPVPVGVPGELYVGGDGLSRGYLNNPEMTHDRIIPNPNATNGNAAGDRIYATGDRARWHRDGTVEFLGRKDHQVKIRGYRIEPGEIENRLATMDGIAEAVVIDRTTVDGEKYLCAYVVAAEQSNADIDVVELRNTLQQQVPDYMVPAFVVQLDEIPLTPNGKVDRRELPEPDAGAYGSAYAAPRNPAEEKLVAIWADILRIENDKIGIDSDFFEMGGHSLKATLLTARIHKEFSAKIPLVEIFKTPTIRELAHRLNQNEKNGEPAADRNASIIEPAPKQEYYPLSWSQKGMYFLWQLEEGTLAYNIMRDYELQGPIDREEIETIFKQLIRRHEVLRTSYHQRDNEPVQKVHDEVAFGIEYHDISGMGDRSPEKEKELIESFDKPFDLTKPPLMRAGLIKTSETRYILMVTVHHITADVVSTNILMEDFAARYEGKEQPPLRIQYKDYAVWQNSDAEKAAIKRQEEYWLNKLKNGAPVLKLRTDYPRPEIRVVEGNVVAYTLSDEDTKALKELAARQNVTLYMVLLAMFNILLSKLSKQQDIVIGTPIVNRAGGDLERVVGFFVNVLVLWNRVQGEKSVRQFLEDVKQNTLEAFENRHYPFEELVRSVEKNMDLSRHPIFDIAFTYLENEAAASTEKSTEKEKDSNNPMTLVIDHEEAQISNQDITLMAIKTGEKLVIKFEYSTRLFNKDTIERYKQAFQEIVSAVIDDPGKKIQEIKLFSGENTENIRSTIKKARESVDADFDI